MGIGDSFLSNCNMGNGEALLTYTNNKPSHPPPPTPLPILEIRKYLNGFMIPDTAFLYPDLRTALVGRWQGGQLVSARPARLRSWEESGGVLVPAFQFTARTEFR